MYIIWYETKDGRRQSMPSSERELKGDLRWLAENGDKVVKVEVA